MDDGAEVELFGCETWEALSQVLAGLPSKNAERSGSGSVSPFFAVFENVGEKIEVGLHREKMGYPSQVANEENRNFNRGTMASVDPLFFDRAGASARRSGPGPGSRDGAFGGEPFRELVCGLFS